MFFCRQTGSEFLKHQPESVLCLRRRKGRHGRQGTEDQFDFRNYFGDQLCIRRESFEQSVSPILQLLFAFGEDLTNQVLKCLYERRVWNVPSILIELARYEVTAFSCELSRYFVDQ